LLTIIIVLDDDDEDFIPRHCGQQFETKEHNRLIAGLWQNSIINMYKNKVKVKLSLCFFN
jgi:hypothetical protein